MDEYDKAIVKLAELVESREKYQRSIGELAFVISEEYGTEMLEALAEDLKENHGLRISVSTLQNYLWVYKRLKDLNIPEDFSFRTLQSIASSVDPQAWAEKIEKEGLSSAEVFRLIRIEKGYEDKKAVIICPKCHKEFELLK